MDLEASDNVFVENKKNHPRGTRLKCNDCPSVLFDPLYTHHGVAHESVLSHMEAFGAPRGWVVKRQGNEAWMVCPACIGGTYNPRAKCGKCGFNRIATRHCHGAIQGCETGVSYSHLHRVCQRCQYVWIETPKDATKTAPAVEMIPFQPMDLIVAAESR